MRNEYSINFASRANLIVMPKIAQSSLISKGFWAGDARRLELNFAYLPACDHLESAGSKDIKTNKQTTWLTQALIISSQSLIFLLACTLCFREYNSGTRIMARVGSELGEGRDERQISEHTSGAFSRRVDRRRQRNQE